MKGGSSTRSITKVKTSTMELSEPIPTGHRRRPPSEETVKWSTESAHTDSHLRGVARAATQQPDRCTPKAPTCPDTQTATTHGQEESPMGRRRRPSSEAPKAPQGGSRGHKQKQRPSTRDPRDAEGVPHPGRQRRPRGSTGKTRTGNTTTEQQNLLKGFCD